MARGKRVVRELPPEETLQQALVPVEEQPHPIPSNWCWVRLGALLTEIKNGTTIKQDKSGSGHWVTRIESLQNQTIDFNRLGSIVNDQEIKDTDWYKAGDIALSHINSAEHVGKTALINVDMLPLVHGMNLLRLRFYDSCMPIFFQYYSQSFQYKDEILARINMAVNQVSINQKQISSLEFPLPPISEQQRIVDRIESLFAKLDETKEKAQAVVDGFELRKAAILHKAFTGELTEWWRTENNVAFSDWKQVKFGDLGVLERGRSKHRPRNDPKLFGGKYPFIQTGDVARSGMYVVEHSQTLSEIGMEQSRIFPKDTLCITIAANIGDVSILTYDCCFPDSVVGFTPNDLTSSKFIYYMMSTIQRELEANAPATAQKNINLKILNDLMIDLPSPSEQNEIIAILEKFFEKEQQAKEAAEAVLDQIDTMKKAILARAFRGELGTNDPAEEWAGELVKTVS